MPETASPARRWRSLHTRVCRFPSRVRCPRTPRTCHRRSRAHAGRAGVVACQRRVHDCRPTVPVEPAEVAGGIGDRGVGPVQDARAFPAVRIDQDVLGTEVVVTERWCEVRFRHRRRQEGLDRPPHGRWDRSHHFQIIGRPAVRRATWRRALPRRRWRSPRRSHRTSGRRQHGKCRRAHDRRPRRLVGIAPNGWRQRVQSSTSTSSRSRTGPVPSGIRLTPNHTLPSRLR